MLRSDRNRGQVTWTPTIIMLTVTLLISVIVGAMVVTEVTSAGFEDEICREKFGPEATAVQFGEQGLECELANGTVVHVDVNTTMVWAGLPTVGDLFGPGFLKAASAWLLITVPMLAFTGVWVLRRTGHRDSFSATEALLLWGASAQMVTAFGLGSWMMFPSDRVASPVWTVIGTELLGVLFGTLLVLVDYGLWRATTNRLPGRGEVHG